MTQTAHAPETALVTFQALLPIQHILNDAPKGDDVSTLTCCTSI